MAGIQTALTAFDAIASVYDDLFSNTHVGRVQRQAVWSELDRNFRAGQRVLDINCGTGLDALHLAARGLRVDACDASPAMIARARENAEVCGNTRVHFSCLRIEDISAHHQEELYDGIISNFSGLNCVDDLAPVARTLARMVRPGGCAVVCVFGVCCLWEILWYVQTGRFDKAFRRFARNPVPARLGPGATVTVHYRSVRELTRTFAPYFVLEQQQGIGVSVPPSYAETFAIRFPALFRAAAAADPMLGRCPLLRSLADHTVLTFRRVEVL